MSGERAFQREWPTHAADIGTIPAKDIVAESVPENVSCETLSATCTHGHTISGVSDPGGGSDSPTCPGNMEVSCTPVLSGGNAECSSVGVGSSGSVTSDAASAAKKRRKQSKPVRCWAPGEVGCSVGLSASQLSTAGSEPRDEDDDGSEQRSPSSDSRLSENAMQPLLDLHSRKRHTDIDSGKWSCPHCDDVFENDEYLRLHIELEHVQKLLERQLQQQSSFFQQQQRNLQSKDFSSSKPSTPTQAEKRAESPLDFAKNFSFPGMPPLIPISQGGPDGKLPLIPLNVFSNPMAQFLFPGFPGSSPSSNGSNGGAGGNNVGGNNTSSSSVSANNGVCQTGASNSNNSGGGNGSGPPTTPGGSLRIFNPEAFCELCNKEFCNKYFLKTHKANKHGIYSVESLVSSPYGNTFFPPGMQQMLVEQQQQLLQVAAMSRGPISGTGSHQQQQQHAGIINIESFCEICNKEFCNKYFLKKHKQKIHGIVPVDNSPSTSQSAIMTSNAPSSNPTTPTIVNVSNALSSVTDSLQQQSVTNLNTDLVSKNIPLSISSDEHRNKMFCESPVNGKYNHISSSTPPTSLSPTLTCSSERKTSPVLFHQRAQSPMDPMLCSALTVFTPEKLREMGVINAEAFCEICCKEFCNKYFLRTHKQNKHGIMDPTLGKQGQSPQFSPQQLAENLTKNNHPDNSFEDGLVRSGADFDLSSSGGELSCDVCNRPFSSQYLLKMHKFYNHNIPYVKEEDGRSSKASSPRDSKLPPKDTLCKEEDVSTGSKQASLDDSGTASPEDAASQDLQKLQSMIRDLTASITNENRVTCHVCRTDFENKYFLRAHMMNEHGVLLGDDGELGQNPYLGLALGNSPAFDSEAYCEICQKEFCSKYFLRTHKQNIHGINMDLPPGSYSQPPSSDVSQLSHEQEQQQQFLQQQQQQQRKAEQQQQNLRKSPSASKPIMSQSLVPLPLMPPPPNSDKTQRSYVTGRNYCNICNKELCNKYFMKTHMLKMHGINLDEQPADAARNSIIGGVTCEICQKELCSKYFLKVHKQNTHGIYEDPPPGKENSSDKGESYPGAGLLPGEMIDNGSKSLSHYTEICPLCDRRFKSIKWLKTHMLNDHSDMLKENLHRLDSPASLLALMPPPKLCIICGQGFPDKVSLQIHLIKEHRTSNEELGLMNLSIQPQMPQQESPQHRNSPQNIISREEKMFRPPSAPAAPTAPVSAANDLFALYHHEMRTASPPQQFPLKLTNGHESPASEPSPRQPSPSSPSSSNENTETFKHPESSSSSHRVYRCSYCVYSTRWLSNLYAHEKRHTGVTMEGDKRFICRICHRAYRYNHSLQRHMLNHRPGSLGGKLFQSLFTKAYNTPPQDQPEDLSSGKESEKSLRFFGNRRFRCSRCNKKYRSRELCLSHIYAVHDTKLRRPLHSRLARPFRCRLCAFATRSWNVLKIHIIRQHQQPAEEIATKPDLPPLLDVSSTSGGANNNNGQLPMTYVIPQSPPTPFILQPFLLAEPENAELRDGEICRIGTDLLESRHHEDDAKGETTTTTTNRSKAKFVPSLVYLPVCQKVSQPMTVAFTLTPA